MGVMVKDRLAAWALRHAYGSRGDAGGVRLLMVDDRGVVRDLGEYAVREIEGLTWAVGVAYRCSTVRWERTRLAGLRAPATRLARAIRKS